MACHLAMINMSSPMLVTNSYLLHNSSLSVLREEILCELLILTFRSCMGDHVGKGCPVCHVPAWVQDMQINRQLEDMVQLCSKLVSCLLHRTYLSNLKQVRFPRRNLSKKGQIKMWFSPRSRKIRCVVNKNQPKTNSNDPCQDPSSVYHFFPSPVHEEPSKPTKKPTQRQSKKMKRKRLADINKVWGLEKPEPKGGVEEKASKEKSVTICSEPVVLCTPEPNSPKETLLQESIQEADSTKNLEEVEVPPEVKSSEVEDNDEVVCPVQVSKEKTCAAEKSASIESKAMMPLKRGREQSKLPGTSRSKRQRSEGSLNRNSDSQTSCSEDSSQDCPVPQVTEPKTSVQVCGSVMKRRSSAARSSPSLPKSPSTPSTFKACNQVVIPQSPSVFKSPGSNTIARRNYKGETLLHIASVKGDLAAVEELLKSGADPNVKDNAGWTPLHEACNHGHQEVVELLLQHKALVNSTGYQNDSPLHDAAKNGHVSIVELLLLHGASRDAVNIFGLRPVDYAESEKMKSVLMLPVKNESFSFSQPSEVSSSSTSWYIACYDPFSARQ
uniref:BARD1 Zinc finger RING-type domain-containing protein n=1 Tax=Pavo cristatus TaxID=9049 RepID=A0A8C9FQ65_PAVCR